MTLTTTKALTDVLAERERQKTVEGWTITHDDEHDAGTLAFAASAYALSAACNLNRLSDPIEEVPETWPWDAKCWKPKTARKDLVRATALMLAEIESLDRKAEKAA